MVLQASIHCIESPVYNTTFSSCTYVIYLSLHHFNNTLFQYLMSVNVYRMSEKVKELRMNK
jgi:hypothetical protein